MTDPSLAGNGRSATRAAPLVATLAAHQPHWSVGSLALRVMTETATPQALAEAERAAEETGRWRAHLLAGLRDLAVPTGGEDAPFVLAQVGDGAHESLRSAGWAVRRGDTFPGLDRTWVRIAVRDPHTIDAVLMYAQRGSGKRSSFYSDYTFGCWNGDPDEGAELLPVGKAYSGFTDEELKRLDRHVRQNTVERFGPVRETDKSLVFEVAFDSVHESRRHKSGLAMRFPRIHRVRWDKPPHEADRIDALRALIRD